MLVAGGTGSDGGLLDSAELYDPSTDQWTATGLLPAGVSEHTATLVTSGDVLLASSRSNRAFLYNPSSGTWTMTAPMSNRRSGHTATILPRGRVLVAGGELEGGFGTNSAEISSAGARTWSPTVNAVMGSWLMTSLATVVNFPASTLLPSGNVLISGDISQLYNVRSGAWTCVATNSSREVKTVLLPSGKSSPRLCFGRLRRRWRPYCTDDATGTWTQTGPLNIVRSDYSMTLLRSGKVLVAGGEKNYSNGLSLNIPEIYDPATGVFTTAAPALFYRTRHTATLLPDGRVLIAGGMRYNPSTGGSAIVATTELYNPVSGTWTQGTSMRYPRYRHTATVLPSGKILMAGGFTYNGRYVARAPAELYDPATTTWSSAGVLIVPRGRHTATLLPDGKVLIAGGWEVDEPTMPALQSVEIFDPETLRWTLAAPLLQARVASAASLLPNGKVLVTSGYKYPWSAELYDAGVGSSPAMQPQIASISRLVTGSPVVVTGAKFRGVSEGSGGGQNSSPGDYPLLALRSLESGQTLFLNCTNWSATSFCSGPLPSLAPGWAMATVIVNGVPSSSALTLIKGGASITLANLVQTYNGLARPVSVSVLPAGVSVTVSYDGLTTAPTNLGTVHGCGDRERPLRRRRDQHTAHCAATKRPQRRIQPPP